MSNNRSSDNNYIEALCNGEEVAYRYFIKTYQNMAFTLAISIVKDEFAGQEIAQDAFFKSFQSYPFF
ncbi:RNA polymerase sigma factor [Mucilaginibacter sp. HD30]